MFEYKIAFYNVPVNEICKNSISAHQSVFCARDCLLNFLYFLFSQKPGALVFLNAVLARYV